MNLPPKPWRYPYQEDGPRLDTVVMRPIVPITLVGNDNLTMTAYALVDSGCEHVLVSQGLARSVALDIKGSQREIQLGIGGKTVSVSFHDATLRLHPDGGEDDVYDEWHTEIGLVREWRPTFQAILGQVGFFDKFTVMMSRHAREVSVDAVDAYDRHHPPRYLRR